MGPTERTEEGLAAVLAAVAAHPRDETVGYGAEVRAAVVAYASAARRGGAPWRKVLPGLPVSEHTVRDWMRAAERDAPSVGALVPVRAHDDAPARESSRRPALTLVSPSGYRVEGLDVETTARLLQSLH